MKFYLLLLISFLLIISCSSKSEYKNDSIPSNETSAPLGIPVSQSIEKAQGHPPKLTPDKDDVDVQKETKLIKDGQIEIEADDISKAKTQIDALVDKYQAYYGREQFNKSSYRATYSLNIRIPSKNFEKFVDDIEHENGNIKSKNINANDVTETYYDIVTRLENKRAYLKQYQALLKKANTIKDILEIQEKIRRLEEEIESSVGRLKYMDDKVKYSTLSLQIYQTYEQKYQPRKRHFWSQISRSFKNGFQGFLDFIVGLVSIWPFILVLLGLWFFRKKINFRFWKKRS